MTFTVSPKSSETHSSGSEDGKYMGRGREYGRPLPRFISTQPRDRVNDVVLVSDSLFVRSHPEKEKRALPRRR